MSPNVSEAIRDTRVMLIDRSRVGAPVDDMLAHLRSTFAKATFSAVTGNGACVPSWREIRRRLKAEKPEMVLLFWSKGTRRRFVMLDSKLIRLVWRGPVRCLDEDWLEKVSGAQALFPDTKQYWRWRSFAWTAADDEACRCSLGLGWLHVAMQQVATVAVDRGAGSKNGLAPVAAPPSNPQETLIHELLSRVGQEAETLKKNSRKPKTSSRQPILYSRLDYWNKGSIAGGSLGHTAHVIRGFCEIGADVRVAAGFKFPLVDVERCPMTLFNPPAPDWYSLHLEHQYFAANACMGDAFAQLASSVHPAFIYERIVIGNCVAAKTAQRFGIPYVVEYNGSEIWVLRHWAKTPLHYEEIFLKVEDAVLHAADMIVVVSEPLRQELLGRGIESARILVNSNAVDPHEFDAARLTTERERIRAKLKYKPDAIVLGFIGTFGAWHGIPTLAKALPDLARLDSRIHVLLIGDGNLRKEVDQAIHDGNLKDRVVVTGIIPQAEAPAYLSACDVFLSPHQIPSGDERPFFGSPTKLFEYMSMSKPTIASDLGQISEVLTPALRIGEIAGASPQTDAVGVLITPGDAGELVAAVDGLIKNSRLEERLANNARKRVLERHTWDVHVSRIVDRLETISGQPILQRITGHPIKPAAHDSIQPVVGR